MIERRRFLLGAAAAGGAIVRPGLAAAATVAAADKEFIFAGNVLGVGPPGRCDDFRLGGPVVRWDETLKLWRMWYYCRSSAFPKGVAPAFGTGSIALAHSADGFRWQRVDGALPGAAVFGPSGQAGRFDELHVATGDILRHQGEWWMFYFGGNSETPANAAAEYTAPGFLLRIGLARSRDGFAWERVMGPRSDGALLGVIDNDVYSGFPNVFHDGSRFVMQYTTADKLGIFYRSRVVTSADGIAWHTAGDVIFDDEPGMFETGGMITRDVIRHPLRGAAKWLMAYTAKDGRAETGARRSIALAESRDGMRWSRVFDGPIFTVGNHGAWDSSGVAVPKLVATRDDLRLYYYGWADKNFTGEPLRGIGCASCVTRDLRQFRRVMAV